MFNPPSEVDITLVGNSLAFAPNKIFDQRVFENNGQLFFCDLASGRVSRVFENNFDFYTDADIGNVSCFHLYNGFIYRAFTYFVLGEGHYIDFHHISSSNSPGEWEFLNTVHYPSSPPIHGSQSVQIERFECIGEYLFIGFSHFDSPNSITSVQRISLNSFIAEEIFNLSQLTSSWNSTGYLHAHNNKLYLFAFRGTYPFNAYYSVYEWSESENTFIQNLEVFSNSMPAGGTSWHYYNEFASAGKFIRCGFCGNDPTARIYLLLYDTQTNTFKRTSDLGTYFNDTVEYGRIAEIVFYNEQYFLFLWDKVYAMDPDTCALTLLYTFPAEAGSTYFNLLYVTSSGQLVGLKTTATTSEPISFDGPLVWVTPYSPLPIPSAFVEIIYPVVPRDEDNVVAVPMGNGGYRRERKTENVVVRRESTLRFRVDRSYIGTFEADLHSRRGQLFRLPTPGYTPFGVNSSDNLVYCLPHKGAKPTDKFASTFDIDVNFLFVSVAP